MLNVTPTPLQSTPRSLRDALRDTTVHWLHQSGITRAGRVARGRLTIVTFHRVLPDALKRQYPFPGLAVTPDELDWMLSYFVREYQVGSLREASAAWASDSSNTRPHLALTFDDGQLDNYEHARPILARHNLHATFYLPVDAVQSGHLIWHDRLGFAVRDAVENGRRTELKTILRRVSSVAADALDDTDLAAAVLVIAAECKRLDAARRREIIDDLGQRFAARDDRAWAAPMRWEHARQLATDGHEIGSHSLSHTFLTRSSESELDHEMRESRRVLEQQVGARVQSFCYPDGDCDSRTQHAARSARYENAVTTRPGSNSRSDNPFALCRYDMTSRSVQSRHSTLSVARLAFRLSDLRRRHRS